MAGRGRGAPPDKGPPSPAPGVSSLPPGAALSLKEARQGAGMGWGEGLGRTPCDTPTHTCGLAFLQVCPSKSGTSLLQSLPLEEASSGPGHQGALRTGPGQVFALRCKGNRPQDSPRAQRGLSRAGLCLLQRGPCPQMRRKLRHWVRKATLEDRRPLRPVPHWPLRLHPGLTFLQALLSRAQVIHGARPFGTALFLMLLHWRKSPCSFQESESLW